MTLLHILILSIVQGAAELLPVSSSAHVIVAEKLMGLDPTRPEMTLLLVMLHTGTMFAVIFFFWKSWKASFFSSRTAFWRSVKLVAVATILTGIVGVLLKTLIEKVFLRSVPNAEIELIFGNLLLVGGALAAAGVLIVVAGLKSHRRPSGTPGVDLRGACWIGGVQGLCLPFRGFSRSGATISTGLLRGIVKERVEEFSFALAVVLTPPVILRELMRFLKAQHASLGGGDLAVLLYPSLAGMVLSFLAGLVALKWLSSWLEKGRWHFFGIYCLVASAVVFLLRAKGL